MFLGMLFIGLPTEQTASAQNKQNVQRRNGNNGNQAGRQRQVWQGNGKRQGPKWNHGYKNYGQYRKTQVGNRRYRMVKRSYWSNGARLYRNMRVYY